MEIPIKMDDLEVPLFLETSSWISMGIIILSREWREIKGVQKPCGVVASSVFSPRKGDTHFPRNFHFGGYPFVKSILSVFLPGIQYLPLFCLEKNSGFWRLQPPKWRTNRFQEYIIYIYISPFLLVCCIPFMRQQKTSANNSNIQNQLPTVPRYDPIRGLVSYGLQMWHQLSAPYGGTRSGWFGQGHASLLYDFQLHRGLEGNYKKQPKI